MTNKAYIKEAIINQINTHGITFTTIEDKKCFIGDIQILIEDILDRNSRAVKAEMEKEQKANIEQAMVYLFKNCHIGSGMRE